MPGPLAPPGGDSGYDRGHRCPQTRGVTRDTPNVPTRGIREFLLPEGLSPHSGAPHTFGVCVVLQQYPFLGSVNGLVPVVVAVGPETLPVVKVGQDVVSLL